MLFPATRNWALVLVKDRRFAKARLAGILQHAERMALQDSMLADVLSTLAGVSGLEGVAICSPDRRRGILDDYHDVTFIEQPRGLTDMNGAAAYGAATLASRGASFIGVMPADLPLLETCDVEAAFDATMALGRPIVIPDRLGKGTNGLFLMRSTGPTSSSDLIVFIVIWIAESKRRCPCCLLHLREISIRLLILRRSYHLAAIMVRAHMRRFRKYCRSGGNPSAEAYRDPTVDLR